MSINQITSLSPLLEPWEQELYAFDPTKLKEQEIDQMFRELRVGMRKTVEEQLFEVGRREKIEKRKKPRGSRVQILQQEASRLGVGF
jgi:hypothetical protein